jgi:enoyl-CoA hydratase/carnithine racemase
VNAVYESSQLMDECKKLAETMAQRSPQSLMLIKKSINSTYGKEMGLAMQIEAAFFSETFGTFDQKEGVSAFIEKRKPTFKNIGEQR